MVYIMLGYECSGYECRGDEVVDISVVDLKVHSCILATKQCRSNLHMRTQYPGTVCSQGDITNRVENSVFYFPTKNYMKTSRR